jgi:transmembrane sensor
MIPTLPYTEWQRREAVDWFLIIHGKEHPKPDSLQAWLQWMELDEGNRLAFESVAQAWHGTPAACATSMPTAEELLQDEYSGDQPVEEWLLQQSATPPGTRHDQKRSSPRAALLSRRAWLAAASLAAVTFSLFTLYRTMDLHRAQSEEFATKTGEQLRLTLADGSRVWLGPKSRLIVNFAKGWRRLQLTSGEAYFSVHKDRDRPFIVRSSGGDITAVGTEFNVRAVEDRVTVAVSEGTVSVAPAARPSMSSPASVQVTTGQQLTFTAGEPTKALAVVPTPTPGERARWRDGVLIYRDEALKDVVMDIVRYSDRHIDIDPAVGELRYSGVIYQSAVGEWTDALPESFPVQIISEGDHITISAR